MARATAVVTTAPGSYSGASVLCTINNGNTGDGNEVPLTGRELLVIQNTNGGAQTWTATSVDDPQGRVEHITTEAIAAGAIRVWGPVALEGWQQANGMLYFAASHADVKFIVIRLP